MTFRKLTEVVARNAYNHKTEERQWLVEEKGCVLVNLDKVLYINQGNGFTELTFMDYDESSCSVRVKESFEEVSKLVTGYSY